MAILEHFLHFWQRKLFLKKADCNEKNRHPIREIRNLAETLGNDLDKVEYIEMSDFIGLSYDKLMNLSTKKLKTSTMLF